MWWMLGALLCAARAVKLPDGTFYSGAVAPVLATAILVGWKPAVLLAGVCALIGLVRLQNLSWTAVETMACFAGIAAHALVPKTWPWLPAFVAPTAYLALVSLAVPRKGPIPAARMRASLRLARTAAALLALAWPAQGLGPAALIFALFVLDRGVENEVFRVHSNLAYEARRKLQQVQLEMAQLHHDSDRARRELQASVQEREQLENFTQLLTRNPSRDALLDLLFRTVKSHIRCDSLAVFDGALEPAAVHGPHRDRVLGAPLAGLQEPLLQDALRTSQPRSLDPEEDRRELRYFPGEKAAVALPWANGAFYLGRAEPALESRELRWLIWVLARCEDHFRMASRHEALQKESERGQVLSRQVTLLGGLLEGFRELASTVDKGRIARVSLALAEQLLGASSTWIGPPFLSGANAVEMAEEKLAELSQPVLQSFRPLLIDDPRTTIFSWLPQGGWLVCPLLAQHGCLGVLVLHRSSPFQRDHQEIAQLLGVQTGIALSQAGLFHSLQESQAQVVQTSKLMAIGQLAAGVAHELNSPLGAISLMLEGIGKQLRANPDSAERKLETARSAVTRARAIVEKLLAYSRQSDPVMEEVELAQVAREAVEFLLPQLKQDGLEVLEEIVPCGKVKGRAQELQQVVINLLINAGQACQDVEPERKKILVRTGPGWIMVQDAGSGIPPEVQDRIFEPFFTTRPVGRGTGLGLSVSQQIVAQHGGRLRFETRPGQGTRFWMELPVV